MSSYDPPRHYLSAGRGPASGVIRQSEWEAAFGMCPDVDVGGFDSEATELEDPVPAEPPAVAQPSIEGVPVAATFVFSTGRFTFAADRDRSHEELEHHTRDELAAQLGGTDVPASADSACAICMGEREVSVQFGECSHGACGPCLEGVWYSRQQHETHLPTWVSCHMCRAEVCSVGALSRAPQAAYFGEEVVHGGEVFTVWGWQGIRRWMAERRESVGYELGRGAGL